MSVSFTYQEIDDHLLLSHVASGDPQAFGQLFDKYHPAIYTIILRLIRSEDMAEDLCQDCFLKVWLLREQLPVIDNFPAWLRTIAANLTYDALRKRKADTLRNHVYGMAEQQTGSFTSTEALLLEKEYTHLVQSALHTLPEKQQQAFILVKQQGLSREEAATVMGVTPETIKSNLQAATQKMRAYCMARLGIAGVLLLAWATR